MPLVVVSTENIVLSENLMLICSPSKINNMIMSTFARFRLYKFNLLVGRGRMEMEMEMEMVVAPGSPMHQHAAKARRNKNTVMHQN